MTRKKCFKKSNIGICLNHHLGVSNKEGECNPNCWRY